jgi:ribosomal protein S18 acetylase RimI-like enzyme
MPTMGPLRSFRDARVDDLEALRPIWASLVRHHAAIGSAPLQEDEALAWRLRRDGYARMLADGRGFVLVVDVGTTPVGYCAVELHDGPDDTFPVGDQWAEIYTLAVLPGSRGGGVGSALMDAVDARLAALGIAAVAVAAMVENEHALAFYRRRGFVPREVVMWRFRTEPRSVYPRAVDSIGSGPTAPREEPH